MSLSVGIVGLPNVGKSTLFNALLKRQAALVANYPFTTIEPNVGVVPVPDRRLEKLREVVVGDPLTFPRQARDSLRTNGLRIIPATIRFVDIAGLVAGAHKGEGLGNQFLAHIRECDLICHVLRGFEDPDVARAGSVSPVKDLETVRTELILKDLEVLKKQKEKNKKKNELLKLKIIDKLIKVLNEGKLLHRTDLCREECEVLSELFLLTLKPEMVVLNVSEDRLANSSIQHPSSPMLHRGSSPHLRGGGTQNDKIGIDKEDIIVLSAKLESELGSLSDEDQRLYLKELGVEGSALERFVKRAYEKLDLISFFTTTGGKEIRSWSIKRGTPAIEAAKVIHSDFAEKFIKAKVIFWEDFVKFTGWTNAKEAGKVRFEGKDYQVREGEVVEFVISR